VPCVPHTIPALHPRTTDEPRVDLQLYRIAHRSMQKGAHDVAALADDLRRGRCRLTPQRARALQIYVRIFTEEIRRHHESEDDVGWAVISGSAGSAISLEGLSSEHEELEPILMSLDGAARRLAARPSDTGAVEPLAVESARLRDLLDGHIAEEERDVFPVITEYVSVPDYTYWEQTAIDDLPKRDLWWIIPWVFAAVPAEEHDEVMRKIGPVLRLFHGKYRRHHRRVFA
jgi:hemerythrin-like domain-containing protein